MTRVQDGAGDGHDSDRALEPPEELGGEAPCWAHLFGPDEDLPPVVADRDDAGGVSR